MRATRVSSVAAVAAAFLAPACTSLQVGTEASSDLVDTDSVANAYASLDGIRPYDGTILDLGLWGRTERAGEIVSIDLWPLAGVGVGLLGARVQVLPLEIGAGVGLYTPSAEDSADHVLQAGTEFEAR